VRLADAFGDVGVAEVADGDFLLTCTCGLTQRLDATQVDEEDDLTLYDCARCGNSLVGVMPDDAATALWVSSSSMTRRQEVGGHRRRGYLIGSKVDVALRPPDARDDVLLIPATPSFFAALRNL
jgi:Zn ribbon nucleic-acid-binding protein